MIKTDYPVRISRKQRVGSSSDRQNRSRPSRWGVAVKLGQVLEQRGDLENAIALTKEGVMNPEGLRFPDEFVRHKMLDIIGDLALCGMPILGHVRATRSGHGLHTMLLSTLLRDRAAWEVVSSND